MNDEPDRGCSPQDSVATQLALIRRDIAEIHGALYGNARDKIGLVARVESLAGAADRGRWALRIVLWLGGAVVAFLTALGQLRNLWTSWWGHG